MPNHVTTKISAPKHVIKAMLNQEGRIDFNMIVPFLGSRDEFDGINFDAEQAARYVCGVTNENSVRSILSSGMGKPDITKMTDESFNQFVAFMQNYRECGYLHSMDFARDKWGTKWNAYDQVVDVEFYHNAKFDTAWSCPVPVLVELSKKFPEDEITVVYADEDIGSNCGTFILKNGDSIYGDIAISYRHQTDEELIKWKSFAYDVKGWEPENDE